jgi:protein SCO1/2
MKASLLGMLCLLTVSAWASTPADQNAILSKIDFAQNLDAQVPLNLPFRDEAGKIVHLSDYFKGKPVLLSLVYYRCPMLCTESLNGLLRAIRSIKFNAGREFNIVTVSFDASETPPLAAAKKQTYVARYGRPGADSAWAFLVGGKPSIRRLTESVGFRYAYDAELGQFAHGTGLVVLTPDGRVSKYLYGVEYSARDLKLALIDASAGRIGSPVDKILLYCYHYDPLTGKYNLRIFRVLRLAGAGTVFTIGAAILILLRREKKVVA